MIKSLFTFIPSRWILNIATLGKVGFLGKMPGTNGSFVGLIYYTLFFHTLSPLAYLFWAGLTTYIACIICTQAEFLLGKKDPSCVILDEMVAIPFCFLGLQFQMQIYPVWVFMLLGFLLFRFFDIVKPLGIKKLQQLNGGLGIVIDDIAAALASCCCLHIICALIA